MSYGHSNTFSSMSGPQFAQSIETLRANVALAAPQIMNTNVTSTPGSSRPVRQSARKKYNATPRDSPAVQSQPAPIAQQTQPPAYPSFYTAAGQNGYVPQPYYGAGQSVPPIIPPAPINAVPPLPSTTQALLTSYASRMKTGVTLLMQPIIAPVTQAAAVGGRKPRVNYAEGASADEFGEDSEDSEAGAARARRAAASRLAAQALLVRPNNELDQSYLGKIPPTRFIVSKPAVKARHHYYTEDVLKAAAENPELLVPVRVEVDTDTHRIRDCFVWNLNEKLITPEAFAQTFCQDLDLPLHHVENIVNMIRAQLEEYSGTVGVDISDGGQEPDCRVIIKLDVQIDTHHLLDHLEWDLSSTVQPEEFAQTLCNDLGLSGEAIPLVSHAIREEILKHKKDAVEWGVVGGGPLDYSFGRGSQRGPRRLKGVWRDWMEVKDYGPRIDELTSEELEKREMEKERASRRMRRETSKFQRSTVTAYYRDRNRSSRR